MSKTNTFENELLLHLFNNSDIALVGDATGLRGSTTAGSLYVSLHTGDPGEAGDQTTSETAYTGYARVAVARSGAGFTVTGNSVSPAANIDFGECTASPGAAITHFGIGTSSSAAGKLLYKGTVTPMLDWPGEADSSTYQARAAIRRAKVAAASVLLGLELI